MKTAPQAIQTNKSQSSAALSDEIWKQLSRDLRKGDDSAASALLAAGIPIYYSEDDTPAGLTIKEHPDGRRQLVRFDPAGDEVIREL
jgi:hypothetical protein|tara:strand:- start:328 stop:588 length:261 start_codon:yes stop_codon:yes gene_type:complete